MNELQQTMAHQVAQAASAFQFERTGCKPEGVDVKLEGHTLVITIHGALTRAERDLSATAAGAAKVQDYHRQLFAASSAAMRLEIKRITGIDVREAVAEVEATPIAPKHVYTGSKMMQVFQLAEELSFDTWNGVVCPKVS